MRKLLLMAVLAALGWVACCSSRAGTQSAQYSSKVNEGALFPRKAVAPAPKRLLHAGARFADL